MIDDVMLEAEEKMEKAQEALRHELMTIRTGRASPALVENLRVEYYGSVMPLNQLATIAVPEPRLITIRPWDAGSLSAIEKAIQKSELGLTPQNDGKIVRLPIPSLTDERRRDLGKIVSRRVEEARVAVRNIRRDALKEIADLEKDKEISEDEQFKAKDDLQKLTDDYIKKIDHVGELKQAEITES
ncbi:MAG: ribosome recycling factor [Chloroflexi bacterium]|nr:ribosome recycling factor [Chloroflexota bacterium]